MSTPLRIERASAADRRRAHELEAEVFGRDHEYVQPVEPGGTYFVAKDPAGAVVASFRILGPDCRPFEAEQWVDLDFLGAERRVALIGRLVVRPDHRAAGRLPVDLMRAAYAHCCDQGYTDLLMHTFRELGPFYERALFRLCDVRFHHPGFGRELEILRLDLVDLAGRLAAGDRRATVLYGDGSA